LQAIIEKANVFKDDMADNYNCQLKKSGQYHFVGTSDISLAVARYAIVARASL